MGLFGRTEKGEGMGKERKNWRENRQAQERENSQWRWERIGG